MTNELVEELFAALVAKPAPQREELFSRSGYPQSVKEEAARLVKAYESKSPLLNEDLMSDIIKLDPKFFDSVEEEPEFVLEPGTRIGSFKIESLIGQGGMSIVYRAIQKDPVKRRVAIKLIRPSLFAPKTVLRFFREQQALALVAHPNIATLYEVGKTDFGHPFAAMEFVNGLPITAFCEKFSMESRQRMILFIRACQGLKHAHRNGIIHRDVKPDNILVTVRDKKPVPKLIDFGIAKINRADLTNNQTMTRAGQLLGSPRYMSPEQFASKPADQRSDVYSCALVLFEMLARSPYRKGNTTEEIILEARRPDPELLSQRIRLNAKELPSTAFQKESPEELIKFCKRDLDWVMAKALAKDPQHRYPSVKSFVKDLRAVLLDQEVSASKPGPVVRSKSFLKRKLPWVIAAGVGLVLLAAGIGLYNWSNSASQLTQARKEISNSDQRVEIANEVAAAAAEQTEAAVEQTTVANEQTAAANDLIMRLLASDMYELTTEQFDLGLIPVYQSQYERIKDSGGPETKEDKTVYGILAVLYAMSGDFDLADSLMGQVADDQQKSELQLVRSKICAEYATNAKKRLAQLDAQEKSFERASQQLTLGRCYIVWGMLDDAKGLLNEAIAFFDSNDPGCYQSLVARKTLLKIYQNANEDQNWKALLLKTHELFKDNDRLLATPKGRDAFASVQALIEQSSKNRQAGSPNDE